MRYGRLQCFGFGFGAHAALRGGGQLRLHRLPGRLATLDCRLGAQLGVCGHHLFFLSSDKYFFLLAMLGAWSPFLMSGGYLAAIVALGSYIAAIGVGLAALPLAMAGAAAVEVGVLVRTWGALGASVLPTSAWNAALGGGRALLGNPAADLDLTANTDSEDLVVFFGDILEFAEQDKSLLVDAISESWFFASWHNSALIAEAYCLTRLRRQVLSAGLARLFNA